MKERLGVGPIALLRKYARSLGNNEDGVDYALAWLRSNASRYKFTLSLSHEIQESPHLTWRDAEERYCMVTLRFSVPASRNRTIGAFEVDCSTLEEAKDFFGRQDLYEP